MRMSANNRRRDKRVALFQDAVIHVDQKLIAKCGVLDVSKSGARLFIDQSVTVPVEFTLRMSRNGNVSRQCCLMWRNKTQMGVRFYDGSLDTMV